MYMLLQFLIKKSEFDVSKLPLDISMAVNDLGKSLLNLIN